MNPDEIYNTREDLMTPSEIEEFHLNPKDVDIDIAPPFYRRLLLDIPLPDAESRVRFERRLPALGLSSSDIDSILPHVAHPLYRDVQRRIFFRMLRSKMLRALIPVSGAATLEDLVVFLRKDLESGPAKVPDWYTFSTVTMGPRKIGYDSCCNRDCFATEDLTTKFMLCGGCQVCLYCGVDCQKADWKIRHKKVCK